MSNLSELLPAGGAGKNVDFVASGTLGNGVTVGLKADGTVEAIVGVSASSGTPVVFEAAVTNDTAVAFDSTAGKVVIAYTDSGNSGYGTAVVGTVSGTSISFGTPVIFESANTDNLAATFDSNVSKIVISYRDRGNSNYGTAIVGTVSGTSISFGSATVFESANTVYTAATFDSTANKTVIAYRDVGNSNYCTAVVGTISGTGISFGTPVVFESASTSSISATFDSNVSKIVIAYQDAGNSDYGTAIVGTVSGTSISFGSATVFESAAVGDIFTAFDTAANKVVIAYQDQGNSYYGTAIVGTVSGTSISFGSATVFESANTGSISTVFDTSSGRITVSYADGGNTGDTTVASGTVSGTEISFVTPVVVGTGNTYASTSAYDSTNNKVVIAFVDNANGDYGTAVVFSNASSNNTSFLGITDAAIADGASGSVTIKGGVAASVSNVAAVTNLSAASVFANADTEHIEIAFDPNNANKCVICYQDDDNSNYGTAIVGTVSGTSISFGSEVVFASGNTYMTSLAFDPNNSGKLVIAYSDLGNSSNGTAVVGTVAGTSISFGSEVVFCTGETQHISITFNSSNTCVITYRNEGNSNYGEGIVGSVSGTSISFGTAAVFNSNGTGTNNVKADPNTANSVVVAYTNQVTNPSKGGANVGTVSGTSISWGSNQQFDSGETEYVGVSFDPNTAGKFVIVWRGGTGSDGASIIGNVSGTSISYGTKIIFKAGANQSRTVVAFDTNKANRIILSYGANQAYVVEGTITGNSIAWSPETKYGGTGSGWQWLAIDPSAAGKFAVVYQDQQDSSKGKVIMGQFSTLLAAGSDYYVQGNGTISTVSTSPAVKIGRALSSTKINLEFNT